MTNTPEVIPGYTYHEAESPFIRHVGALYRKDNIINAAGVEEWWAALRIAKHHVNIWDYAHATLISTFAEVACGMPAYRPDEAPFIIIQINVEFLAPPKLGDLLEGCGIVARKTRSLCFTQARGMVGDTPIFTASAIHKRIGA